MSKIPLSKTTKFIVDNRGKTAPTVSKGIPLIATNCISNDSLYPTYENLRYVSQETYKNWFRSHPLPGDIILTLKGSQNGAVCIVPNPVDFVIAQDMVALRPDETIIDPLFLFAALRSDDIQLQIKNLDVSGVIPHLKKSDFDKLILPYPDKNKQKAIGSFYFNLSKKMDLLHRQISTLEQMADTLFRKWFIEDAKEDWKRVKIKDFEILVTDFVANGSFASLKENVKLITERSDYALFVRNTDLKSDFTQKVFVDEHAYNFLSKTKLFGGEVIISSVGDVGSVFRCPNFQIPMTLGNNVIMLRSSFNLFFYLFFKSEYGQSLIYGITSGSVQEKFNKTAFRDLEIHYPTLAYIEDFERMVSPFFDKIDKNKEQIQTLKSLRDKLLPKLMSGEVHGADN